MLDERIMAKGDRPHKDFYVISHPSGSATDHFIPVKYDELEGQFDSSIFILNCSYGRAVLGNILINFMVSEEGLGKELVSVEFMKNDALGNSKYMVNEAGIEPIYSKVIHKGHLLATIPYAISIALAVMFRARFLLENRDGRLN